MIVKKIWMIHSFASAKRPPRKAVFKAGAGRHPWNRVKYTECCWSTPGRAEFRPAENADPGMGEVGVLREVSEVRVETMCPDGETMRSAVKALLE